MKRTQVHINLQGGIETRLRTNISIFWQFYTSTCESRPLGDRVAVGRNNAGMGFSGGKTRPLLRSAAKTPPPRALDAIHASGRRSFSRADKRDGKVVPRLQAKHGEARPRGPALGPAGRQASH